MTTQHTPTPIRLESDQAKIAVLLEAVKALTAYVQQELIPSVRENVGGQRLLDKGWELVVKAHTAIAQAERQAQELKETA